MDVFHSIHILQHRFLYTFYVFNTLFTQNLRQSTSQYLDFFPIFLSASLGFVCLSLSLFCFLCEWVVKQAARAHRYFLEYTVKYPGWFPLEYRIACPILVVVAICMPGFFDWKSGTGFAAASVQPDSETDHLYLQFIIILQSNPIRQGFTSLFTWFSWETFRQHPIPVYWMEGFSPFIPTTVFAGVAMSF